MAVVETAPPTAVAGSKPRPGRPADDAKTRVFISYSRKDSGFAVWLRQELGAHGVEVFRDVEDTLPGEEWWRRLQGLIGQADTVVFVLSANSATSPVCRDEAAYAVRLNKRIFPAVVGDIEWSAAPEGLAKVHSIFFRETDDREAALEQLVKALQTDIGWVREHTRLGELAAHWFAQGHPSGDLLRGSALDDAERWLTSQPKAAQPPTSLHQEYIHASRNAARRRTQLLAVVSLGVAVATSALGLVAFLLKLEADAQRSRVQLENSQMLNEFAKQNLRDGDPVTAALLALEALPDAAEKSDRPYFPYAELTLHAALHARHERLVLGGTQAGTRRIIRAAIFSPDGRRVVTAENDGRTRVWDAESGRQLLAMPEHGVGSNAVARTVGFRPGSDQILVASDDGAARLWDAATGKLVLTIAASKKALRAAAFRPPDGEQILTAGLDKSAALWDGTTGVLKFRLTGHRAPIEGAAFSPDGHKVVTASEDRQAWVWSADTGAPLVKLIGHGGAVYGAVFSADGKWILTASDDRTARLWDAETGREVARLSGHEDAVLFANFSPDGRFIVTTSADRTARLWDARRLGTPGAEVASKFVLRGHTGEVRKAAFTSDGSRLVTTSEDRTARVWDVASGQELAVLKGHEQLVSSGVFSPDNLTILTASDDATARLWRVEPEPDFLILKGQAAAVVFSAFSADGSRLVTTSEDGTAVVWSASTGEKLQELIGHKQIVVAAAFDQDGKRIVTASHDGTARVWDADSGRELQRLQSNDNGALDGGAFSPDGRLVLTASATGSAALWDGASGRLIRDMRASDKPLSAASFSPDGRRIVTASADHTARIWDADSGKPIAVLSGGAECRSAAFGADGRQVVTSDGSTARIWDAETGQPIATHDAGSARVLSAAFDRGGANVLMVIDKSPYAIIWNVKANKTTKLDGRGVGSPSGSAAEERTVAIQPVSHAAFSFDGRQVVTASDNGIVRVWNAQTGAEIDELRGHRGRVLYAVFSPDGRRIVSTSADRTARLWRAFDTTQALLDYAKQQTPRCLSEDSRLRFGLSGKPPSWCAALKKWPTVRTD